MTPGKLFQIWVQSPGNKEYLDSFEFYERSERLRALLEGGYAITMKAGAEMLKVPVAVYMHLQTFANYVADHADQAERRNRVN